MVSAESPYTSSSRSSPTFEPLIDPIVSVDDSLLVMSFEAVVEGGSEGDALAPEDTLSPSDVGPEPDSGPPTDGQAPEDGGPVEDIGPVEDTEAQWKGG